MRERLNRAQVPAPETWNLDDLYPSFADWEAALVAVEAALPGVTQYKGRLGEGAAMLHGCLDAQEALHERLDRAANFAGLHAASDATSAANQSAEDRVNALMAEVLAALSFIRTEILALPEGAIARYLAEEPKLVPHKRYLDKLLQEKPHVLSAETEEALAAFTQVAEAAGTIYGLAKAADMSFANVVDSEGHEHSNSFALYEEHLETSPDTTLRRNAFAAFTKGLDGFKNTFAATFATEVKKNVVLSKLRKYESATHMLLQPQEVSLEAYNTLLDVIQAELAPIMRKYARLRKRVLGLDKMLYCDIEAPLDPTYNPTISYEECTRLIIDALAVMGPDYQQIMRTGLTERWVDRADNIGKSTGAFCAWPYRVHPYILMTFTGVMRGVFTLAHELGHAGHNVLSMRKQRYVNMEPSMFFVEAPSTINELLVGQHILAKSTDSRMRRWVIMQFLATYHHNFVRHLLEGELQRRIYRLAEAGESITATTLSTAKGEILDQFWAGEVVIDEGAKLTWMRQGHYYMGLYPYTYSAGLTLATAVAAAIRTEGQPAVDRWLKTLEAGGTMGPLELAELAGVNMAGPEPFRKAVAYVGSLVDELEKSFA